ncbi:MAG: flagellin [Myxococcota bacterium]|nr:flagellin [Myxococcota bacterium]MEE2778883.1 flagellin [Myxococcota bacterium]
MASSAFSIKSNHSAQVATNRLSRSHRSAVQSVKKLSSGQRAQSASESATAVAMSATMSARIGSFHQARTNIGSAVAMVEMAEAGYQQLTDILVEMRAMAVEGANDHLTDTERDQLDVVYSEMKDQIARVSRVTEYNGISLLDGTGGDGGRVQFMTGIHNEASGKLRVRFVEQSVGSLNLGPTNTATRKDSQKSVDRIDSALESLHEDRAVMAGHLATLNGDLQNLVATTAETEVGLGGIRDLDLSNESMNLARQQVLQQAGASMLTQANVQSSMALRLLER